MVRPTVRVARALKYFPIREMSVHPIVRFCVLAAERVIMDYCSLARLRRWLSTKRRRPISLDAQRPPLGCLKLV
jgi:hypothetical protein